MELGGLGYLTLDISACESPNRQNMACILKICLLTYLLTYSQIFHLFVHSQQKRINMSFGSSVCTQQWA